MRRCSFSKSRASTSRSSTSRAIRSFLSFSVSVPSLFARLRRFSTWRFRSALLRLISALEHSSSSFSCLMPSNHRDSRLREDFRVSDIRFSTSSSRCETLSTSDNAFFGSYTGGHHKARASTSPTFIPDRSSSRRTSALFAGRVEYLPFSFPNLPTASAYFPHNSLHVCSSWLPLQTRPGQLHSESS